MSTPPTAPPEAPPWPPPPGAAASTCACPSRGSSSSSSPPPHAVAAHGAGGGSTSAPAPSCAACKHQRRKCTADCVLAPYFPANQPEKFRNSRRLFGVKNMLQILKAAGPAKRDLCMRTIIYESDVRRQEPVHGCRGVIQELENQLRDTYIELAAVQQELALYRQTTTLDLQPPDLHGAASPTETTNLDVVRQHLTTNGQATSEMQWPGPPGAALSLAASEFTMTQPQPAAMQPRPAMSRQTASDMSQLPTISHPTVMSDVDDDFVTRNHDMVDDVLRPG